MQAIFLFILLLDVGLPLKYFRQIDGKNIKTPNAKLALLSDYLSE